MFCRIIGCGSRAKSPRYKRFPNLKNKTFIFLNEVEAKYVIKFIQWENEHRYLSFTLQDRMPN